MPRSRATTSKPSLPHLRSLNVDRDRGNGDVMSRYVVTPNAIRALSHVADPLAAGAGGAWTLTGPYGTGKSAFCVFLSHLLAPTRDPLTPEFIRRLSQVDRQLANRLFPSSRHRARLLPVTLSGSSESLQSALLRSLADSDLELPQRLSRRLRALNKSVAADRPVTGTEVAEFIEQTLQAVGDGRNGVRGVLLIIDELGKLLEYAAANPERSDVFLLQQLAEIAARSDGRLFFLGVLHQDFRGYSTGLPPADRAEWEKIRGRFEDIVFEEPPSQLLRFVSLAWERTRQVEGLRRPPPATVAHLKDRAARFWEHDLAPPGLDFKECLRLLEAAVPLHPLTATLVGPLFRRVGQNERSAFSFLSSDDPTALRAFVRSEPADGHRLYDVVDLYGYLTNAIGNGLLHTADAKRWAEILEAEARHPHLSAQAVATLRAIGLLNIASRWYSLRPTREVLAFALEERCTAEELDGALSELEGRSVIVHRRYNDSYTIWEGSDVDVEARLDEGRSRIRKTTATASLLRRHHRTRPILARRHAYDRGTLRFFAVEFAHTDDIESVPPEPSDHDGRVVVLLPSRGRADKVDVKVLAGFDARTLFLLLPPQDRLLEFALELGAIDWVSRNTPELDNDAVARRELNARRLDVQRSLDALIDRMLTEGGRAGGRWISNGAEVEIRSGRQLNERISRICNEIFSEAPRIDNEIINRRELSSAAAAARGTLIKRMIEHPTLPDLGLDRDPPERSIYRSVLSSEGGLGLHRKAPDGQFAFRQPSGGSTAQAAYRAITDFFDESTAGAATVAALFERLRRPPYGLRDGVIPVLVCAAMLARESDVALYEDGAFRPQLSTAVFERLIKAPERFTIRRWRITGVRSRVFEELERVVGTSTAARPGKAQILNVVRPMLRFFATLPDYTTNTVNVSATTMSIRKALQEAREPDVLLFADLPQACGIEPFKPSQRGRTEDIHKYRDALEESFAELRSVYPALLASSLSTIGEAFGISGGGGATVAQLQERAAHMAEYAVERDIKMLLNRIGAPVPDAERWTASVAAFVAERPVEKWRDEDQARFSVRLSQFARRFMLLEATVTDQPKGTRAVCSVRVSLTGTAFGQVDHAVHLSKRAVPQVAKLERSIEKTLGQAKEPSVAIAALCEVLRKRLDQKQPAGGEP